MNFPYMKTLYVTYERKITDLCIFTVHDVCCKLKRIDVQASEGTDLSLGTILFELYLAIQKFSA